MPEYGGAAPAASRPARGPRRPAAGPRPPAPGGRPPAPGARRLADGPRPPAPGARPTAPGPRCTAHGPRLTAHGGRRTVDGTRHTARGALLLAAASVLLLACEGPAIPGQGQERQCWECHAGAWAAAQDPPHAALGIPRECGGCHGLADWRETILAIHPADGPFPLLGGHAVTPCAACHGEGRGWGGLSVDCWSCHADEFAATTTPDHEAAGYPHDCRTCHGFDGWRPALGTAHEPGGPFPLEGGHAGVACTVCHGERGSGPLSPACYGCHAADYRGTVDPDHVAQGFPPTCGDCHTVFAWRPATGTAHLPDGPFPLTGGHAGRACEQCHDTSDFAAVPRDCMGCHRADYDATAAPDHAAEQFPTACQQCHTTASWEGAMPPEHGPTGSFPLTAGHAGRRCTGCHDPQDYGAVSAACDACHRDDYDGTTNPDHGARALPLACATCHTTQGWRPSLTAAYEAVHRFPIRSGDHRNLGCAECHPTATWAEFTCTDCHAHTRAEMDDEHLGEVSGYSYSTAACYRCHLQGVAEDG
jgi:hypothetical protein